jgi:nitrogenase molybdenum-iron protein beta chain
LTIPVKLLYFIFELIKIVFIKEQTMGSFIERPRYSCAVAGALAAVNAIKGAVPILHASQGCGGTTTAAINGPSGFLGSGYCGGSSVPSSGINEKQIVFGGATRLEEQIKSTAEIIDADLFVVISGCTAELIGDDITSVVNDYNENPLGGPKLIYTNGAGFKGDTFYGYDALLQTLITDYVEPASEKKRGYVNLWGIPPALDVFWEGNIIEIRRILTALGLKVNSFFTIDDSLAGIRAAAQAELNIVASPVNGIGAAELFKEVHGVDYISTDLPIGAKATESFVLTIAERLGLDKKAVGKFIEKENEKFYHFFNRIGDAYCDIDLQRYTVIIGDATYASALTRFVTHELGWIPGLVVITDQVFDEQKPAIVDRFVDTLEKPDETVVFETDSSLVSEHLSRRWPQNDGGKYYEPFSPAFVLGSRLDRDFADSIKAAHLSVTYPVSNRPILDREYAGYRGGLRLIEDIYAGLLNNR